MTMVDRVRNLLVQPKEEWQRIDAEPVETVEFYRSYIGPLAAIGPVASVIGLSIVGVWMPYGGTVRVSLLSSIAHALVGYVLALIGIYVVALIVDALAPTFSGRRSQGQALKVAAYASTPGWLGGVFLLIPSLGILTMLASLYGIYLLYLGLPLLMKTPQEKAVAYVAAAVGCAIAVFLIFGVVSSLFMGGPVGMMPGR
jgi:hypothetical protein